MSRFNEWFLRNLVRKLLGQQQLKLIMRVVAEESIRYYTETNEPTLRHHLTDMVDKEIIRAWDYT